MYTDECIDNVKLYKAYVAVRAINFLAMNCINANVLTNSLEKMWRMLMKYLPTLFKKLLKQSFF